LGLLNSHPFLDPVVARQDRDYRYKERLKGRDHEAIST
jgi:hypothetical protein